MSSRPLAPPGRPLTRAQASRVTQAFVPFLRKAGQGRIVMMSSSLGSIGELLDMTSGTYGVNLLAYNSSKSALNMSTACFAKELLAHGVGSVLKESRMPAADFAFWTLLPFPALVLAIAAFPLLIPHLWEKRSVQIVVVFLCTLPVVGYELAFGHIEQLVEGSKGYLAFVITLGALFTTSGGILLQGDIEATPRNNLSFLLSGALLASVIGTTGASMLLIRPLLKTNQQRDHRDHLVPFFILIVANAGGLLLPLGDPPLLVGYIMGVPFFWTLRLFPIWLLYVASLLTAFYLLDKRAYARETKKALTTDRREVEPLSLRGRRNLLFLGRDHSRGAPARGLPRSVFARHRLLVVLQHTERPFTRPTALASDRSSK